MQVLNIINYPCSSYISFAGLPYQYKVNYMLKSGVLSFRKQTTHLRKNKNCEQIIFYICSDNIKKHKKGATDVHRWYTRRNHPKKKEKKYKKEHIDHCFSVLIKLIFATKNKGKARVTKANNAMLFPIHMRSTQARTERTIYATQRKGMSRVYKSRSYLELKILQLNHFLTQ